MIACSVYILNFVEQKMDQEHVETMPFDPLSPVQHCDLMDSFYVSLVVQLYYDIYTATTNTKLIHFVQGSEKKMKLLAVNNQFVVAFYKKH